MENKKKELHVCFLIHDDEDDPATKASAAAATLNPSQCCSSANNSKQSCLFEMLDIRQSFIVSFVPLLFHIMMVT